jgi:IS5 family transposase
MYIETPGLFKELMPFGGQIDQNNRWVKMAALAPWLELDIFYKSYFSPGKHLVLKPCRLITGLMIGKQLLGLSDRKIVEYFHENPYFQYFCGMDTFVTGEKKNIIHHSLLTKRRQRLGPIYFAKFEAEVFQVLKRAGLVTGKEAMLDATVAPANIEYPNDVKLMNVVREWACKIILRVKNAFDPGRKIRTYRKQGRKLFLNFQKHKKKSRKLIIKSKKQMARFLKRNLTQLTALLQEFKAQAKAETESLTKAMRHQIENHLKNGQEIYRQQLEMIKHKTTSIKERIVSFSQPQIRPIVRGKEGKPVEFGAKLHLSLVDGFAFLDRISFTAFSEQKLLSESLAKHQERFERQPENIYIDDGYSSRENRALLAEQGIEHSLKLIGKATPELRSKKRKMRRKRSRIEGLIGNLKKDFNLDRIKLTVPGGAEIQSRLAVGTHNLVRAMAKS